MTIPRELGDTAPAAKVPQALAGIYTSANSPFAEQEYRGIPKSRQFAI